MKKLPELKSIERLAIIQTAFLGDVVLALYLAQSIKNFKNDLELTFVTTPAAAAFVNCAKAVDNMIIYDKRGSNSGLKGIHSIADELRHREVQCILAPHRSLRTTLTSFFAKSKYSVGFDKNAFSLLYNKRVKYVLGHHEVQRNIALLKAFSDTNLILNGFINLDFEIPEDDKIYIDNLLSTKRIENFNNLVAIAPGSVWETKRWLPEYFKTLTRSLQDNGYVPILIGSKNDDAVCKKISIGLSIQSLCGETSLPQLLYFLSLCKLTITNDSSPTHFAGAVNCPVLTIYGATIPGFGFAPLGKFDRSIGIDGLKCRPCAIHGGRRCPIKTFDCMVKLTPDIVLKNAIDILENSNFNYKFH